MRRRSDRVKKIVIVALMLANLAQHLLKQFIWPHYWGDDYPSLINTAYNMCATLIMLSPFIFISKSGLWKDFITYVGVGAGLITMAVPYWYIGQSLWQWDILRYYFCHGLLFITSLLPAITGLHKVNWRNFYKLPFVFFFCLILIVFDYLICYALGIFGDISSGDFFEALYEANPCWMMHPDDGFGWLTSVIAVFTPGIFMDADGGTSVPLLWYAIPMYLLICVLGFVIGAIADRRRFSADMRAAAAFIRRHFHKKRHHGADNFFARRGCKAFAVNGNGDTAKLNNLTDGVRAVLFLPEQFKKFVAFKHLTF